MVEPFIEGLVSPQKEPSGCQSLKIGYTPNVWLFTRKVMKKAPIWEFPFFRESPCVVRRNRSTSVDLMFHRCYTTNMRWIKNWFATLLKSWTIKAATLDGSSGREGPWGHHIRTVHIIFRDFGKCCDFKFDNACCHESPWIPATTTHWPAVAPWLFWSLGPRPGWPGLCGLWPQEGGVTGKAETVVVVFQGMATIDVPNSHWLVD